MAYGVLYTASFKDKLSSITFKVDILQDGYGDESTEITYMGASPVSLKYSSTKGKDQYIIGSSLTFAFKCLPADSDKYDPIFEGDLKEFKIKYYQAGGLIWEGYIQSDNLTRSYLDPLYEIVLNASDWLANLKDVEFRTGTTTYSGNATVLQNIKTCLGFTGIELDFVVQLGTYETTYMVTTSDILKLVYINRSRFTSSKDGKTKYTSVYDVLTETLKPFNCTLKQVQGKYHIVNIYELDSYYNTFTWSNFSAGSRTGSDNIVDIDAYTLLRDSNYNKLKPELRIDFQRNANDIGGELIGNLDDFGELIGNLDDFTGGGPWDITADDGYIESSDIITITDTDPNNNNTNIEVSTSSLTATADKYMKVVFDVTFLVGYEPDPIYFDVRITKPSSGQVIETIATGMDSTHYESGIIDMFAIDETGVYIIEINTQSSETQPWATGTVIIENVRITSIVTTSTEYDQNYIGYIDANGQVKKEELFFGDANSATDQGGLKAYDSGYHQTANWRRYGETDDKTIQELWVLNLLKNRQLYKNMINLVVIDDSYNIHASTIIQIDSVNYKIIELETDPSYTFSTTVLTTINGESTETGNPIGGDTVHGNLDGLGNDDHSQYHNNTRGDARYYTKALGDAKYAILVNANTFTANQTITSAATAGTRLLLTNSDTGGETWAINSTGSTVSGGAGQFAIHEIGTGIRMYIDSDGRLIPIGVKAWDTNGIKFYVSGGTEYWRMENDGDFHAEGDIIAFSTTVSDRRLKKNIKPLYSALEKMLLIKGVSFSYIKNDDTHIGIIAQDLIDIIPEVVVKKKLFIKTGTNKKYYVIRYTELIPYIIESIKELSEKIDNNTKEIEKLKLFNLNRWD